MDRRPADDPSDRGTQARESLTSYETFFGRYYPRVVRFLRSQACDANWAEDVAMDTMVAAFDKWNDLLIYDRPDSWLFKVAIRTLRRLEAKARETCSLSNDLSSSEGDLRMAAVSDDWVDDHLDLIVALRSLPRRQSEVLALHHMLGYTLTETAEILQIDKLTVKTHLYRALARLRQQGHQTQPEPTELGGRIR